MLKKIIVFLTGFLLILNSTLSNATTVGAWTLSNPMAVGASILYDGSKGAVTSSVLITPNASQVAKVLRGGIAGYALTLAVEQLLGAVDWVLDPANNQIRYFPETQNPENPTSLGRYCYFVGNGGGLTARTVCSTRASDVCNAIAISNGQTSYSLSIIGTNQFGNIYKCGSSWTLVSISNPDYDPNAEPKEKTLPLETVAQKVIKNAESDNLDAQFAVLAAANNILSEAEQDDAKAKPIGDELENNAKCPSGIISEYGQCWICDKTLHYPMYRATRDAKNATRNKSCKNITDPTIKAANAVLFRNLISARSQENACWSPIHQNHITALNDAKNALILCEN